MNVQIKNHCKKSYKLDAPNIIQHILNNISEKFLIGLTEVRIFDPPQDGELYIKYIPQTNDTEKQAIIEVYMDNSMEKRASFFYRLFFNAKFIDAINKHIEQSVKPVSTDEEILLRTRRRFPFEWFYIGRLTFIIRSIMKIVNYLYTTSQKFRDILYYWAVSRQNKKHK